MLDNFCYHGTKKHVIMDTGHSFSLINGTDLIITLKKKPEIIIQRSEYNHGTPHECDIF